MLKKVREILWPLGLFFYALSVFVKIEQLEFFSEDLQNFNFLSIMLYIDIQ